MTYVVTESCIKCKYMDCVEACPVNCFYEGENMLAINPSECIDCGVCEPECPTDAIFPDNFDGMKKMVAVNAKYSQVWPKVTRGRKPGSSAKKYNGMADKFSLYFSSRSGQGDRRRYMSNSTEA